MSSQATQIKNAVAAIRKAIPRFTNVAMADQASQNARDTRDALLALADVIEDQLTALDARVTALE